MGADLRLRNGHPGVRASLISSTARLVATGGRERRWSFSQSFHQPQRDATGAHQLDDASNLGCRNGTRQYATEDAEATHNP